MDIATSKAFARVAAVTVAETVAAVDEFRSTLRERLPVERAYLIDQMTRAFADVWLETLVAQHDARKVAS